MTSRVAERCGSQRPRLQHLPGGRSSAGSDAVEFAASCGLYLDDWQAWCLEQVLSEDDAGRWATSAAVILLPRQNGKNAVLEALELYAFFVLDEKRIIHTAQLAKTAADHMRRMVELIRANVELEAITHVYWSNGKEALERTDTGARLEFITRGKKTVRGGSPTRVVFDEALFLTDEQIQAIMPALSAQSMNDDPPQLVYTSSAPLPESTVLHRLRKRALSGEARGLFFAEWGCELGCDITDRDLWYEANPGLGVRISEEWVGEQELPILSPEAFAIERLGVVYPPDDELTGVFPDGKWASARDPSSTLAGARVAFGFDISPDSTSASIAWAGIRPDGVWHGEIVERADGTAWVVPRLVRALKIAGTRAVAVAATSTGAALLPELKAVLAAEGIELEPVEITGKAFGQACEALYGYVMQGEFVHHGQEWLDTAVAGARQREQGDVKVWDRKRWSVDITPLCAVTVALRAFQQTPEADEQPFFMY